MQSVAASLVSQLKAMEKKFKALEDKCVDDNPQKFTDPRSYQQFDKLKNDCVELFNEAERFLAQRHPWYVRYETPGIHSKGGPVDYAVHCVTLLRDVDAHMDNPPLPLIPNHPEGWREMPADSRVISVLNPFVVSMNTTDGATNSSGFAKGDKVQIFWLSGVIHGRCPANGRLGVKFGNHQFENIDAMYLRPIAVREHGSYSAGDKVQIHGQPAEVHGETFPGGPILVKINSDYQYCRVDAQYLRRA